MINCCSKLDLLSIIIKCIFVMNEDFVIVFFPLVFSVVSTTFQS